jgi:predicted amidohydrolase
VFDESRYFEPGVISSPGNLFKLQGVTIGQSICEDLWNDEKMIARRLYHQNPIADLDAAGAEILVNASASPFVVNKHAFRLKLFAEQARRFGKPLVYVNQVGGNDELVFDGNSVVLDGEGNLIAQAKDFEEDLLLVEVPAHRDTGLRPVLVATGLPDKVTSTQSPHQHGPEARVALPSNPSTKPCSWA